MALIALGAIGVFFGRLIQSAVSRQREFLADASAVQFTRNPGGLSGHSKKLVATAWFPALNPNMLRTCATCFSEMVWELQ